MRKTIALLAAGAVALAPAATLAKPTTTQSAPTTTTSSPFGHTGQPNQSCEDLGNQPGTAGSSDNTGSAFSPSGQSGGVYAGEQAGINDKNDHSVSQYDTACAVNGSNPG
jgi:hypothetical protein